MNATQVSSATEPEHEGLMHAIDVLRERWWVVVVAVITCLAVSLMLTLRTTKEYTATAKLLFAQNPLITEVGGTAPTPSADPQADQATNLLVVTTNEVAAVAKRISGLPMSVPELLDEVSTSNDQSSNIVDVAATDQSPTRAAQIANAFAEAYVVNSQSANRQQILAGEQQINQKLDALPPTPANAAARANLEAALQRLVTLAAVQTGDASVVDHASVPTSPSSPNKKVNLIIALVFGLALGVGLAFLLNVFDRRLKSVGEFEELYGMRALATVPWLRRRGSSALEAVAAEQFLIVLNGLSVLTPQSQGRVVLVTSAVSGEGKTTVAIGLARAAASSGRTVILVEADFQRPAFGDRLGVSGEATGLTAALAAGVDPGSLLRSPIEDLPGLSVLASGRQPTNSAALLRGPGMGRLLERFASDADLIVLDAPPLLPAADAQALLDRPELDACLVVGRMRFTKRDEARYTAQLLERREPAELGLVLNGMRRLAGGDYYRRRLVAGSTASAHHGSADRSISADRSAADEGADLPHNIDLPHRELARARHRSQVRQDADDE